MKDSLLTRHLLRPLEGSRGWQYRPAVQHLLHLVAEVPKPILAQTRIHTRSRGRYLPFYSAMRGGGAITLGSRGWQSITFTENFFSIDQSLYKGRAYGNDVAGWLDMSAHEAGHLLHAVRFRFFIFYLLVFAYQYLRYGHDAAPLEIEAEAGRWQYRQFDAYVRQNSSRSLVDLITSDSSEADKIEQLNAMWRDFRR